MKKIRKFLATVGLSILYIEIPTKIFDYLVSTSILEWQGPVYGFLVIYPCAVVLRYRVILFYDKHCSDALGIQKPLPKAPATASSSMSWLCYMYQKVLRLLWYIQVILFWGILAYHEPVFIVLRLRKTKEFSPRTLALLAGSVLLSSLIWIGMLDTIILASKEIGKQILNHLL